MAQVVVFHGTSIQNARSILKEGYKQKVPNWLVSAPFPYFFNYPHIEDSFKTALIQGGTPAFKHNTLCKRAVLAVKVEDTDLIIDTTGTAGEYSFEYTKPSFSPEQVVGMWADVYNLKYIKWHAALMYNNQFFASKIDIPHEVEMLKEFFKKSDTPISVPIEKIFCREFEFYPEYMKWGI